jgi:archaellum component FlaD/FlaE
METVQTRIRVSGYKNNTQISNEWIVAESVQEAYSKYQEIHKEATMCYLTEIEGDIIKNKTNKGKGEKETMSVTEKENTTVVIVEPKTTDAKGNIVPVSKVEKEKKEAISMKEKKTSEKKATQKPAEKKAEVKSVKQPAKVSKQNVKPEPKKPAAPKKEVVKRLLR